MCTIGYHRDLNIIFKNRDKPSPATEEIVSADGVLAGRTQGANYFSWGLNKFGCGFVSAAINSPLWTSLAYQERHEEAQVQYQKETEGLKSPIVSVSSMLAGVKQAEEWVDDLVSSQTSHLGYNVLVCDKNQGFLVETYKSERFVKKLLPKEVVTNHFQKLTHGPKEEGDYPNSFKRFRYGNEMILKAKTPQGVFDMLKPSNPEQIKRIWRSDRFLTISSTVIDFNQLQVFSAKSVEDEYVMQAIA
jgi:hypothetical protein